MFSSGKKPNYLKLRTNLRLCINRLKLMEKKKTEIALKARREIAEYLKIAKDDRARIRVEHIVREDYLVEAMEITEMFCDLLLARFGLVEKMKEMDPGLEEPIATLLWVAPRMSADINELREVANQLTIKYGKEYADACRTNKLENVNEQVLHKMAVVAPPRKLIESYLVEIAKTYDVAFEPDPTAFEDPLPTSNLIDIGFEGIDTMPGDGKGGKGGRGGGGGGGGGMAPLSPEHLNPPVNPGAPYYGGPPGMGPPGMGPPAGMVPPGGMVPPPMGFQSFPGGPPGPQFPAQPPLPSRPPVGGSVPVGGYGPPAGSFHPGGSVPPAGYVHPGASEKPLSPDDMPAQHPVGPPAGPGFQQPPNPPHYDDVFGPQHPAAPPAGPAPPNPGPPDDGLPNLPSIPNNDLPGLPSVPGDSVATNGGKEDIDFDDLTRRFEELKKRK